MQNFPGPGTKTALLTLKPYTGSSLLVTSYCVLHIISAERVGQGFAGWHARGVSAARLGCQSAMFGTGWADSCPGCMDKLRKCYSHFVRGSFLSGKAAWAPERVFNNRESWLLHARLWVGVVCSRGWKRTWVHFGLELGQKWRYGVVARATGIQMMSWYVIYIVHAYTVHVNTVLLSYNPTVLLSCCPTVLPSYCLAVLQSYRLAVLSSYCTTVLLSCIYMHTYTVYAYVYSVCIWIWCILLHIHIMTSFGSLLHVQQPEIWCISREAKTSFKLKKIRVWRVTGPRKGRNLGGIAYVVEVQFEP